MGARYLQELFTPQVLEAQTRAYRRTVARPEGFPPEPLGESELEFIAERDSFYLATVSADGWPYVQHRGGPRGFLKALDARTLQFADLKGNRQLLSVGNVAGEERVSLIAVDYPRRERLKILGKARITEPPPGAARNVERLITIDVVAFDWNCAAYITPRYTLEDIEAARGSRD